MKTKKLTATIITIITLIVCIASAMTYSKKENGEAIVNETVDRLFAAFSNLPDVYGADEVDETDYFSDDNMCMPFLTSYLSPGSKECRR